MLIKIKDKNYKLRKMKGVNRNYKKRFHTHKLYQQDFIRKL